MRGISRHKKKQLCLYYFLPSSPRLFVQYGKQGDQMALVNPLKSGLTYQLRCANFGTSQMKASPPNRFRSCQTTLVS